MTLFPPSTARRRRTWWSVLAASVLAVVVLGVPPSSRARPPGLRSTSRVVDVTPAGAFGLPVAPAPPSTTLQVDPSTTLPVDPSTTAPAAPSTTAPAGPSAPAPEPVLPAAPVPVEVGVGEDPSTTTLTWPLPAGAITAEAVEVVADGAAAAPVDVPVAAGRDSVALPPLAAGVTWRAAVDVVNAAGSVVEGPSDAFTAGHPGVVQAASVPCEGTSYGLGAVTVDGYTGYQGSYCLPPGFAGGTGAYCIDHGLDYPSGAYHWVSAVVGDSAPLIDQYGRVADPADAARLAWVVAEWGSTTDPARAVALGIITHAVMGDYPGLGVASLDPPDLRISGGDPGAIAADTGAMWSASGALAGPYTVTVDPGPGPFTVGAAVRGTVTVTGRGGGPEVGVPLDFSGSSGVSVVADAGAATGADGTLGITLTPQAAAATISARVSGPGLPGTDVTSWTPMGPPVAVQRVITGGPLVTPSGQATIVAAALGQATLVKVSADPLAVPVAAGFTFAVQAGSDTAGWTTVNQRTTAADGTMAPVTGLAAGTYRVVETAHPPAFEAGGPWTFTLAAGQVATWTLTDQVVPRPLIVVKVGDDPADPPGAGATFAVAADTAGDGTYATPVGTLVTGATGRTPSWSAVPGRYRVTETVPPAGYQLADPVVVTVPPVDDAGPTPVTVTVSDHAVPGRLELVKQDAATGLALHGAVLTVATVADPNHPVGTWTSAAVPTDTGDLAPGTWVVTEVRAPAGYLLPDPASRTVTLDPGRTLQVIFADLAVVAPTSSPGGGPTLVTRAPSVAPASVLRPVLAFTGLPTWRLVATAAAALAAGLCLVALTRRRRPGTA